MRFDLVTIFPEYFAPLDLSLVGKARRDGIVDVKVHDLRQWASGKHLSVDDAPYGGGAGMVMRADVWGHAIDALTSPDRTEAAAQGRTVLAIPTPSGEPLTQKMLEDLAEANHVIVACGRYEGIDARLAQHYRDHDRGDAAADAAENPQVEVVEFSLGDYVLNGGEVAALALVEGVARLLDGMVGNPESLTEESHQQGLLEYPVYTQPRDWRGRKVPPVLLSGDHGAIAAWRRDQALRKTAEVRPDLIDALARTLTAGPVTSGPDDFSQAALTRQDRETLADLGIVLAPSPAEVTYGLAEEDEIEAVATLAGEVFPLACPPGLPREEIDQFVAENLTPQVFRDLRDQGGLIGVARIGGQVVGYTLMLPDLPDDIPPAGNTTAYMSKLYVSPQWHGSGIAAALLERAVSQVREEWGADAVILGTNRANKRAIRFYRAHGFRKRGNRTFVVGPRAHHDHVFVREITD